MSDATPIFVAVIPRKVISPEYVLFSHSQAVTTPFSDYINPL